MNKKLQFPKRPSSIVALSIISESEIAEIFPDYSANWSKKQLDQVLYMMGLDTNQNYERQDGLMHRNKLNKAVICSRYVGQERLDEGWIYSGYASQEAKDKYGGSKMVEDLYRAKNLTEDTQAALEARDKYSKLEEEYD